MMKAFLPAIIVLLLVTVAHPESGAIDARSGVRIAFKVEAAAIPESWRNDPVNARITALPTDQTRTAQEAILTALRKYPVALVQRNLTNVYLVDSMWFYDIARDGTYHKADIFISAGGVFTTARDIEVTFHHEMSSLLLNANPDLFDSAAWRALNPASFKYTEEVVPSGDASPVLGSSSEYVEQGFLSINSVQSMEDDFNMLAERLLANDAEVWELAHVNRIIKSKLLMVVKFYHQLCATFTEEYFKARAGGKAAFPLATGEAGPEGYAHDHAAAYEVRRFHNTKSSVQERRGGNE